MLRPLLASTLRQHRPALRPTTTTIARLPRCFSATAAAPQPTGDSPRPTADASRPTSVADSEHPTDTASSPPLALHQTTHLLKGHVEALVYRFDRLEPVGMALLDRTVFGTPVRVDVLHRVVVYHLNQLRGVTTHRQKNRAEVRGSNAKVRPQKRTGMARAGIKRSPIFRGGGRAFPVLPRDWRTELNSKVREMGMRCALSSKYAQGQLTVVDTVDMTLLEDAMQAHGWMRHQARTLILHGNDETTTATLSTTATSTTTTASTMEDDVVKRWRTRINKALESSVYEILCHDHVVLTRQAVAELERRYWCY